MFRSNKKPLWILSQSKIYITRNESEVVMNQFWCHYWQDNTGRYLCFVRDVGKYKFVDKRLPRRANSHLHENKLLKFMRAAAHCSKTQTKQSYYRTSCCLSSSSFSSSSFIVVVLSHLWKLWSDASLILQMHFQKYLPVCTREESNRCLCLCWYHIISTTGE